MEINIQKFNMLTAIPARSLVEVNAFGRQSMTTGKRRTSEAGPERVICGQGLNGRSGSFGSRGNQRLSRLDGASLIALGAPVRERLASEPDPPVTGVITAAPGDSVR